MIELKKDINNKKIPRYENPNKLVDIVEKLLNFNMQQKGKELLLDFARRACRAKVSDHKVSDHSNLKILTPKQMLQRLPIALAQVEAGDTSENLLNEIIKNIYSLYRAKEITKKVYNITMNSIEWTLYL